MRAPLAPSGDDVAVERSMDCGYQAASAIPDASIPTPGDHPLFWARVADASRRIEAGEARGDIRARHGSIVLDAAYSALLRRAGRGA